MVLINKTNLTPTGKSFNCSNAAHIFMLCHVLRGGKQEEPMSVSAAKVHFPILHLWDLRSQKGFRQFWSTSSSPGKHYNGRYIVLILNCSSQIRLKSKQPWVKPKQFAATGGFKPQTPELHLSSFLFTLIFAALQLCPMIGWFWQYNHRLVT